jgi:hypothetical protein
MTEILRCTLGVLLVASLAAVVGYATLFFLLVGASLHRSRRDPLAAELDQVLEEIVGPRSPARPARLAHRGRPDGGGRRREPRLARTSTTLRLLHGAR